MHIICVIVHYLFFYLVFFISLGKVLFSANTNLYFFLFIHEKLGTSKKYPQHMFFYGELRNINIWISLLYKLIFFSAYQNSEHTISLAFCH